MLCVDFIVFVIKYCEIAMQHTFYRIILVLIIYVFFILRLTALLPNLNPYYYP